EYLILFIIIIDITYLIFTNLVEFYFFFSSRRRHTRSKRDWSSDVCSSDLSLGEITTSYSAVVISPKLATLTVSINSANIFPSSQIGRASCRERMYNLRVGI